MIANFATVCSGIGAPELAWKELGWECEFASEIDPFASAVYDHHFPWVPNLGDMRQHRKWRKRYAINVLAAGTPCQAFSLAGLREGLADPRGNLTLTFLGCIEQFAPRWVVWENVAGVLSHDQGRTFGTFLGGLAKLGYGFAYRVLDAQYFGLAQRRKRVFVIGHSGGCWQYPAAVLFERACLCGNTAPSREARQNLAASTEASPGIRCDAPELSKALASSDGGIDREDRHTLITECFGGNNTAGPIDVASRVGCNDQGSGYRLDFETDTFAVTGVPETAERDGYNDGSDQTYIPGAQKVRRLTPRECERLQGFPDDYTLIDYRGKPACDAPRYKAIGNSMPVPVLRWLGSRIALVETVTTGDYI